MRRAIRFLVVIGVTLLSLASLSCGQGDDGDQGRLSAKEYEELVGPEIVPPKGPPPKKLVIKDLKTGSGPVARRGDRVGIHYAGVFYDTGEKLGRRWLSYPPAYFRLGSDWFSRGINRGVEGMREGGRREMIIPARLSPHSEAMIYVIDLASVEPPPGGGPG